MRRQRRPPAGAGASLPRRPRRLRGRLALAARPRPARARPPDRLMIGGESGRRDPRRHDARAPARSPRHHGRVLRGANLIYGCYDLSMTPSQRNWGERCSSDARHAMVRAPLRRGPERGSCGTRHLAALRRAAQPPAASSRSATRTLSSTTRCSCRTLEAAGNEAELRVWPEGCHGFNLFPLSLARAANDVQHEFLRDA